MRIFLSFAGEQSRVAESIYRKLLAAGYDPFFASDEIRASDGYDTRIREEINTNDHLLFLASEASLEKGRYTLTELKLFSKRFPDPTGRVMAVMLDGVDYEALPPYLGAVTSAVSPQGNVASEVTAEVLSCWPLERESAPPARRGPLSNWRVWGGVLAVVAAVILIPMAPKSVTVPETVVGRELAEARGILEGSGLAPAATVAPGFSRTAPAGVVLTTTPPPGTEVEEGSRVMITTNQFLVVPTGVVGKPLVEVTGVLASAGFVELPEPTPGFDAELPMGAVLALDPPAEQRCPLGTRLAVTVNHVSKMDILGRWKLPPDTTSWEGRPVGLEVQLAPSGAEVLVKFSRRVTSDRPVITDSATLPVQAVWRKRFERTTVKFVNVGVMSGRKDLQERKVGWFVEPAPGGAIRVIHTDGLLQQKSLLIREP